MADIACKNNFTFPNIYIPMNKKEYQIADTIKIGEGTKIDKSVTFFGKCSIGKNCTIKANCVISDSNIGDNCQIENSIIEGSQIGSFCHIGPYSHIRPNCILEESVKVGSFAEIKNSHIGQGSKIPHLSYVGDATLGKNVNVGCGVVFANYNGQIKQRSVVGDNVFIGCNVNIVAPVKIANGTYICAGTTVTKDTEEGDFVIGRVRQENKKR